MKKIILILIYFLFFATPVEAAIVSAQITALLTVAQPQTFNMKDDQKSLNKLNGGVNKIQAENEELRVRIKALEEKISMALPKENQTGG